MNILKIPCETGQVSDGYHTFDELYAHRCTLFLALMHSDPELSWISCMHSDGTSIEGWFIAGMCLPTGDVTYHIPNAMWPLANKTGAKFVNYAPKWDGHTSDDVLRRIQAWIGLKMQRELDESVQARKAQDSRDAGLLDNAPRLNINQNEGPNPGPDGLGQPPALSGDVDEAPR